MRILNFGIVFSIGFGAVFGISNLAAGLNPLDQIENSAEAVGSFIAAPAFADDQTGEAIDFSDLIKIDGSTFEIKADSTVLTQVTGSTRIRKIGHGNVSEVKVVRTPSGTYTTDGFASSHIKYAGIEVTEKAADPLAQFWQSGFGWTALPTPGQATTLTYGRTMDGGSFVNYRGRTCIRGKGFRTCS